MGVTRGNTRTNVNGRSVLNRTVAVLMGGVDAFGGFSPAEIVLASHDEHDQLYSMQATSGS